MNGSIKLIQNLGELTMGGLYLGSKILKNTKIQKMDFSKNAKSIRKSIKKINNNEKIQDLPDVVITKNNDFKKFINKNKITDSENETDILNTSKNNLVRKLNDPETLTSLKRNKKTIYNKINELFPVSKKIKKKNKKKTTKSYNDNSIDYGDAFLGFFGSVSLAIVGTYQ